VRFSRWLTLGLVALAACKNGEAKSGGGMGAGGEMPPSVVEVAVARTDTVIDAIEATGQVEAIQAIELRPDIEGRVLEIPASEGTEVAAGAALVRIDDQELKAQVAKAEADRDLARQALARTRELLAQKASSTSDLEKAEATARGSQAELDLLTLRLGRTTVRAPFAGVVGQRYISLGDYVTTSTRLVSLQTVNPQRVAFRVASLTGQEFEGVVDFVDPVVQLPGRTILIKAVVPNPRRQLSAGMFAEARLATDVRPRAVIVPEDALLPLQGAFFVWVSKDNKATRRQVGIGVRTPGFVEVKSGVEAGEQVVVGGQERLFEGAVLAPTVVERAPVTKVENE